MVFKSSPVWTISSNDLIQHLASIDAPDQLYWDSRSLKKEGRKFQSLDWSHWKKATKEDGEWKFITTGGSVNQSSAVVAAHD